MSRLSLPCDFRKHQSPQCGDNVQELERTIRGQQYAGGNGSGTKNPTRMALCLVTDHLKSKTDVDTSAFFRETHSRAESIAPAAVAAAAVAIDDALDRFQVC
jgi:hypothetical protein